MFNKNIMSLSEAEKEYNLPLGTIRRDIHRGKFNKNDYQKLGRNWCIKRNAVIKKYLLKDV